MRMDSDAQAYYDAVDQEKGEAMKRPRWCPPDRFRVEWDVPLRSIGENT